MPSRPSRSQIRLACRLAIVALALAGCATGPPPPVSTQELSYAETFPYFKLYWVGRSFAAVPLTAVDERANYSPLAGETGMSVYYGNCEGPGSLLGEGTCQLPLQVTSTVYVPHSNLSLGPQRNVLLRGVPAVIYGEGRSIILYSGHLTIEVSARSAADALHATRLLRPLNAPGSSGEPLQPPTYCPTLTGPVPPRLALAMAELPHGACQRALQREAAAEAEEAPAP